mgnify:CR=1 FL=1
MRDIRRKREREEEIERECGRMKLNETLNYDDLLLRYKEESRVAGND